MLNLPKVVVAPYPRTMAEIFSSEDLRRLEEFAELVWGRDAEMPADAFAAALPDAWAVVGFSPSVSRQLLSDAAKLRTIIEVGGHFPQTIDYRACFERGIRVLSCAPAFAKQVAEMAVALTLASSRGLVPAHLAFRDGKEDWQADRPADFTLFGQELGFIGFGSIARELTALLKPFGCRIRVFDPWLTDSVIRAAGCVPSALTDVMSRSRAVYVLATPTPENAGMVSRELIGQMQQNALLVLLSRAHLVDFDALVEAADAGKIHAAIDVFPSEPMPPDAAVRTSSNTILSPHRAASIRRERQAIGRMTVDDLELIARGLPPLVLQVAQPEAIERRLSPSRSGSVLAPNAASG